MPLINRKGFLFSGCVFLSTVLIFSQKSFSAEVDFTSKTYLQFFEDTRDNKHAPFYEYVELNVKYLNEKKLSFYSAGWFRYDLKTTDNEGRKVDELSYAYLRYAPFEDRSLLFNIGRQRIAEGIAVGLIDGISGRWEITPRTGFSLFGGVPVETEFDGRRGDFIYGGRVFQRIERKAEVGFSFLREDNDRAHYREEFGIDLWLLPIKEAEVLGHSFFNNITRGWSEHAYNLRISPSEKITLSALFSFTDYQNAFSVRTLNAFSPEFLGQGEALTKKGGSVEYRLNRNLTAMVNVIGYGYKKSGDAAYYGAQLMAKTYGTSMGVSIHRMEGNTEKLRYTEVRLYGKKSFDPIRFSIDIINLHYDTTFNGLSNAYSLDSTLEYRVSRSVMAGLSAAYSKNPDFSHDTRVLLKLAYQYEKEIKK